MPKEKEQIEHGYRRFIYNPKTSLAAASLVILGTWYSLANSKTASATSRSKNTITLAPPPEGGYTYRQQHEFLSLEHAFDKEISSALSTPKQQESFGLSEPVLPKSVAKIISPEGLVILENTSSNCAMMIAFTPNTEGVFAQPYIAAYGGVILQPGVLEGAGNTGSEVQHIELGAKEIPNGANNVARVIQYAANVTSSACVGLPES
ncbi:MAG TPA: hypothetical protein VGF75_03740 [Candidatus Saccharimonadales bacterium]|jgi:hypothetical protein